MAWNRSSNDGRAVSTKPPLRRDHRSRPTVWGVAGAVVVLGAAVAAWWLWPAGETRQDVASTKKALIKEVKAQIPTNTETDVAQSTTNAKPKAVCKFKTYIDEQGRERYANTGHLCYANRPSAEPIAVGKPAAFKHVAENQIFSLLVIAPGGALFGARKFDDRFLASLKKSFSEPVEILETDSESMKAAKRQVEEIKGELKQRLAAGEDICKELNEEYREIVRLAQYKNDVMKLVREASYGKKLSDNDLADLVNAANAMLEEKGIAPMKATKLVIRSLSYNTNREIQK